MISTAAIRPICPAHQRQNTAKAPLRARQVRPHLGQGARARATTAPILARGFGAQDSKFLPRRVSPDESRVAGFARCGPMKPAAWLQVELVVVPVEKAVFVPRLERERGLALEHDR